MLEQPELLLELLDLLRPVGGRAEPGEGGRESRVGPALRQPGAVVDHAQRAQRLDASAHFDDLAHILFDQALLAEGGTLEDPGAYVKRVNALLVG